MDRSSGEQINVYRDDFFGGEGTGDGRPATARATSRSTRTSPATPIQICPVGALTGEQYRFRARPFDLVSTPSACEHCSAGCAHAHRPPPRQGAAPPGRRRPGGQRGVELRQGPVGLPVRHRLRPASPPRWSATPTTGELREASWSEALLVAAEGLQAARTRAGVGVLTGGRLTVEDAYAYAKFARVALGTNDIDFRARPLSARGGRLPGRGGRRRHRRDLRRRRERAGGRARRARAGGGVPDPLPAAAQGARQEASCKVYGGRAVPDPGLREARARRWSRPCPGDEARLLGSATPTVAGGARALPGALLIVGERLATRARWPVGRRGAGRRVPARSWPGCRGAPVTAARSTPAACRTCCPVAGRSPTRRPVPSWRGLGRRGRCAARHGRPGHGRDHRGGRRPATLGAPAGRRASTRPTWPTRGWPSRRSTRCRSWSAWSCGRAR